MWVLLLNSVPFTRLLSFKDGKLAFHFCPGQCAVGQISNNTWQLADLKRNYKKGLRDQVMRILWARMYRSSKLHENNLRNYKNLFSNPDLTQLRFSFTTNFLNLRLMGRKRMNCCCTSALICRIESRSLSVAVCGVLFTVSKSMVMPNATPISSVLA